MSPLYIGLIVAGVGLLLVLIGVFTRKRAGRIVAAPFMKTGEAARANGAASAQGVVGVQQALAAPCSNTPCAFFKISVERKVKHSRGGQTSTKWQKMFDGANGGQFAIDDGSGPVYVQVTDPVDGELEQTFKGLPPGGPGLGSLAQFQTLDIPVGPDEQILEYRATEQIIRVGAPVFVLGTAQGGQLTRGAGRIMVSTRGRDALIGSTKRKALLLLLAGGLVTAAGAVVAIVQPGVAKGCGALKDEQAACAISSPVMTLDMPQADGSKKPTRIRRATLAWEVTKGGKYELAARDPKKRRAAPSIQVENAIGVPMNIDFGIDLGAGAYSTKTKTMKLIPGKYNIYVFSSEDGPSDLVIEIHPLAES